MAGRATGHRGLLRSGTGAGGATRPGERDRRRGARRLAASVLLGALLPTPFAVTPAIAADAVTAPAARTVAPPFALPGTDGVAVRLADRRGEVVYVDFWASWCPPCLQSFPWMDALAERFAADGLRVVAINLDADRDAAARFLADADPGFDIAFDPAGDSAEAFGLIGMPSSYVIDRDGRVAYAHVGFRRKDAPAIEAAVAAVLAEPHGTAYRFAESGEER